MDFVWKPTTTTTKEREIKNNFALKSKVSKNKLEIKVWVTSRFYLI